MPIESQPAIRGFKTALTLIGVLYVLLASSMLVRGAALSMRPFGLPESVLASPHFADFFRFTFVHMSVLGVLTAMLGQFVTNGRHQRLVSIVLCSINVHYTYLDLRTSDSVFGNGLYRGSASLVPAIIDVVVVLCYAWLSLGGLRRR